MIRKAEKLVITFYTTTAMEHPCKEKLAIGVQPIYTTLWRAWEAQPPSSNPDGVSKL